MKIIGKTASQFDENLIVEMTSAEWQACGRLGEGAFDDFTITLLAHRVEKYSQMRRDLVHLAKVLGFEVKELEAPPPPKL